MRSVSGDVSSSRVRARSVLVPSDSVSSDPSSRRVNRSDAVASLAVSNTRTIRTRAPSARVNIAVADGSTLLELDDEHEGGFRDIADAAGTGGDVPQDAPAAHQQGEAAFAERLHRAERLSPMITLNLRGPIPIVLRRENPLRTGLVAVDAAQMPVSPTFDELIAEGAAIPVQGWDFSWFAGRATEERPSWRYSQLIAERMAGSVAALDIDTGGGEVLAEIHQPPPVLVATESWGPNVGVAAGNLRLLDASVVVATDAALPFHTGSFDLVISRHPIDTCWDEVARVLQPGGTFLSQQIGAGQQRELAEAMLGPLGPPSRRRRPEFAVAAAEAAGLIVVDLQQAALRTVFYDIAAVAYFLRKVVWTVPEFTVERYRDQLAALHQCIETDGAFVSYAQRFLIEARKPSGERT